MRFTGWIKVLVGVSPVVCGAVVAEGAFREVPCLRASKGVGVQSSPLVLGTGS